jgi:hypothetical protein
MPRVTQQEMLDGADRVAQFKKEQDSLRAGRSKTSTFDFPQQVPKTLLADYLKQQKDCMVPKPLGGLSSIKGLEGESKSEWLLAVRGGVKFLL